MAKYGSSDNPAVSCRDLVLDNNDINPDKPYWMDPNSGSVKDAIEVTCRQDGTVWSTCVSKDSEHAKYQFRSLALHSFTATQLIAVACEETEVVGANGDKISLTDDTIVATDKETCEHKITTEVTFQLPVNGQNGEVCFS